LFRNFNRSNSAIIMSRTNDRSLKDAIEQMLQVYKLRRKVDETALIVAWPEMMGKAVANRTKDIFIRDRKLFIRLESAVIKNDLMMMRSDIIEKMNERAGASIIDEIIFL
jgi:predicted nucleic acid-binding Zn ribbon protein